MKIIPIILLGLSLNLSSIVYANEVSIINAELEAQNGLWTVRITLRHEDTGWKHYADAWRVVDNEGRVLGERTLYHPHVNEQPFMRSLSSVEIPANVKQIYIEAHDTVHGWSKDRLPIDMNKRSGDRFRFRTE